MKQVTLQFHCFMYKTAVIIEIMVAVVGVVDWLYIYIYQTAVGINISMIFNGIWRLADQGVCPPVAACGARLGIPQTPYQ